MPWRIIGERCAGRIAEDPASAGAAVTGTGSRPDRAWVRARLLEVGAALDRIDRADCADAVAGDPRLEKIQRALEILHSRRLRRAEEIQMLFSDEYVAGWNR